MCASYAPLDDLEQARQLQQGTAVRASEADSIEPKQFNKAAAGG
jgi:hypothetical protein